MSLSKKSSVDEIRARFDADVERFSDLATGQQATIDAPLALELLTEAAARATPRARRVLDIGCGAGNYTLRLLQRTGSLDVTLVDLSRPMLQRARQRLQEAGHAQVELWQGDIREFPFGSHKFDIVMAGAALHHLRDEHEWRAVFAGVFESLGPGGSFWISDLVAHESPAVQEAMWARYGDYLTSLGGPEYRDRVLAYVVQEDSPRPLVWQLELLRAIGFTSIDVLHKHGLFATFGGVKSSCSERPQVDMLMRIGHAP